MIKIATSQKVSVVLTVTAIINYLLFSQNVNCFMTGYCLRSNRPTTNNNSMIFSNYHQSIIITTSSTTKLNIQKDSSNMNNLQLHNAQTKNNQRLRAKLLPKKHLFRRIHLHRPVGILNQYDDTYLRVNSYYRQQTHLHISTGLTFDDGDQLLVSAQKPLGIVLEEREEGEKRGCVVVEVVKDGNAGKAGVKVGDLLVAVQNADVGNATFDDVMSKIGNAPRVVNLRFWRRER